MPYCRNNKADDLRGTTDEYFQAIAHHFQQSSAETLYPGDIYATLKQFLQQRPGTASSAASNAESHGSSDFAWLVSPSQLAPQASSDKQYLSDTHSFPEKDKTRGPFQGFTDPESCIEALRSNIELSHPQVLFLRGHPSPSWLLSIGAFCYVDPELFRWFLRYRAEPASDYYFDSAPSIMSSIFCFKFFTIGSNTYRYRSSQEAVDTLRGKAANELLSYQNELRQKGVLQIGDSIVRNFHVLDERHCVIEQEIVISIFDVGKTWMGMISSLNIVNRFADDFSYRLYRCRTRYHKGATISMARRWRRPVASDTSPNLPIPTEVCVEIPEY